MWSVFPSTVTFEWSELSQLTPKYNSTELKELYILWDLNSDHGMSWPLVSPLSGLLFQDYLPCITLPIKGFCPNRLQMCLACAKHLPEGHQWVACYFKYSVKYNSTDLKSSVSGRIQTMTMQDHLPGIPINLKSPIPGGLSNDCEGSLPRVSPLSGLPFQDHLLSIMLLN